MTNRTLSEIRTTFPACGLVRPLTDEELTSYRRDGAAIVRQVVDAEWIDYMRGAIDRALGRTDIPAQNYADDGKPRFYSQTFPWMFDDAFKAWALHGPLPAVARQVLSEAEFINFVFDQIFAKEPGDTKATPWHQDFPFLPLKGSQILRIWVPFDTVTAKSGALHYLKGSHQWDTIYHPLGFKNISEITDAYVESPYADWPDFDADHDKYDWLVAEAEPGDLLLHHPMTIHGSLGNETQQFRRAVTSLYTGSDVTWYPHSAHMFKNKNLMGHVEVPELIEGDTVDCDLFPRISSS